MGYEVLDVGGGREPDRGPPGAGPGGAPAGEPDVLDLTSPPERPEPGAPTTSRLRQPRRTALLAAVAVSVGAAGAAYWSAHRPDDSQTAATGGTRVLAVAQPAELAMVGPTMAASLRISVVNTGQVPVDVVVSPAQIRPVQGATLIGLANGGSPRIAPGEARQVVALVGISCVRSTAVTPRLSIKGPDGRTQPVTVRDINLDTYRVNARAVCGNPDEADLTARVAGTVRTPMLVVRNGSHHDVAITVSTDSPVQPALDVRGKVQQSTRVGAVGPPVTLTTVPGLPVVLPAQTDITLVVQLRLRGCQPLATLQHQGYLLLLGVPIAVQHTVPETSSAAVDLTALLGSEQARACG
ncbi:hypothetical protein [Angustibacter luteus]|uniref:Uncharacterized protein n=1 Tax=Angustibacter luteus TaxID=658456 RepID=A0ABW1JFH4_9ACTN